ncbi:MAG: epoxyqueuosine reductase QueH [Bacillota bacterium]
MNKVLLHICCAPCSIHPFEVLKGEGVEFEGYFYNPNIHPYREYKHRLEVLTEWCRANKVTLQVEDSYDVAGYLSQVLPYAKGAERCMACYTLRMRRTAKAAAELGAQGFTTTLLASPYQKHDMVVAAATRAACEFGVKFLYWDFRPGYRDGLKKARELQMYLQPYCGCLFSEVERYRKGVKG